MLLTTLCLHLTFTVLMEIQLCKERKQHLDTANGVNGMWMECGNDGLHTYMKQKEKNQMD